LGAPNVSWGTVVLPSEQFYPGGFEGEQPLQECEEGVNAFLTIRIPQSSPEAQTGSAALQHDLWDAVADRLEGHSLARDLSKGSQQQSAPVPSNDGAHVEAAVHTSSIQSGGSLVGRGYSGHEIRGRCVERLAQEGQANREMQPVMLKAEGGLLGSGYNSDQIRMRSQERQHVTARPALETQEFAAGRTLDTAAVEGSAKELEPNAALQPVVLGAEGSFVGSGYSSPDIRMRSWDRHHTGRMLAAGAHSAITTAVAGAAPASALQQGASGQFCRNCRNTGIDAFGQPCNCPYSKSSRPAIDTMVDTAHDGLRLSPTRCKAAAIAADRLREDDDDAGFSSKPLQDCNMATRAIAGILQNSDDEQVTTIGNADGEREPCKSAAMAADRVREDDSALSPKPHQSCNTAKRAVDGFKQNSDDEWATVG